MLNLRHGSSHTDGRQCSHHAPTRVDPHSNLVEIVCLKGLERGNSCGLCWISDAGMFVSNEVLSVKDVSRRFLEVTIS
ncbi:hypothetical protein AHF37_01933 [Paragonimus kellicotti]|nr:hypothetical protein AHF37_01933 [Paragonimus kellicotti]